MSKKMCACRPFNLFLITTAFAVFFMTSVSRADNLDRIELGSPDSETAHNLTTKGSTLVRYSEAEIKITEVTASDQLKGDSPSNVIDGNADTRWATYQRREQGHWVKLRLNRPATVGQVSLQTWGGRNFRFQIEAGTKSGDWQEVYAGKTVGTGKLETCQFDDIKTDRIRIICHGDNKDNANIITEVRIGGLPWPAGYPPAAYPKALGETGMQLLSREHADSHLEGESWMGGWMAFDIKTDPQTVNYITLKMWGASRDSGELRLILAGEESNGVYRWIDRGTPLFTPVWQNDWGSNGRDQWLYRTYALPYEEVTRGKNRVRLRLQQKGSGNFRPIYSIYTHTNPYFEPPAGEPQGEPFEWGKKACEDAEELLTEIDEQKLKAGAKKSIEKLMAGERGTNRDDYRQALDEYPDIYNTEWSGYYHDERIIHRVKEVLDKKAEQYVKNGSLGMRWAGPGRVYARPYSKLHAGFEKSGVLDEKIEVGGKEMTRREAYARMFKGEFDAFHKKRRVFTNQTYYGNIGLYFLNRALLKLKPEVAIPEAHARWFVYETFGMVPFGPDNNKHQWHTEVTKAGFPRFVVTEKGLTRERGYVVSYGEMTSQYAQVAGDIGDPLLIDRAAEMVDARLHMRSRDNTGDGYRTLGRIGVLGWRATYYPGGQAPRMHMINEVTYLKDPASVRMAELALEWKGGKSIWKNPSIKDVEYYQKLKESLPTDYRLPFEKEKDDYAWADEGNGIFMIHHGDDFIWGSFYMPPSHKAINTKGRVRHITSVNDRIVDMRIKAKAPKSGKTRTFSSSLEEGHESVVAGRRLSIPPPPPPIGEWSMDWGWREMRMGRAWFCQVHYGDYLIGMNMTRKTTYQASLYELEVPDELRGKTARDMISGREVDLSEPVILGPRSTMVLYVGND